MDASHAQFLAHYMTSLWEGEFPATLKVVKAVPDAGNNYRPDEKSRTGWELVTHLVNGDIWFLQSIIDGAFTWDEEASKKREAAFVSVKDVATYYEQTFPAKIAEIRALPADELTRPVDFFGMFTQPAVWYLGFANNHSMHHRGQLAAYLRAMGSKVPAIYGGSADEPMVA